MRLVVVAIGLVIASCINPEYMDGQETDIGVVLTMILLMVYAILLDLIPMFKEGD